MARGTVGVVVNPLSGRDIRRLVAHASVFPNAEKANMVQRLFTSVKAVGVERVAVAQRSRISAPASRSSLLVCQETLGDD